MNPATHDSVSDAIDQAYAARCWETARRLCLQALQNPSLSPIQINARLHQLHNAYQCLGDFAAADAALNRIVPTSREEACELALVKAADLGRLCDFSFYRASDDVKAGHTYEVYREKLKTKAKAQAEKALASADTPNQKVQATVLLETLSQLQEGLSFDELLAAQTKSASVVESSTGRNGTITGTVKYNDGRPAAGVTVTLGLKVTLPFPDPATHLDGNMGGVPEIGPLYALTSVTASDGSYTLASVPADRHEFLSVTLDPITHDITTLFLKHGVEVSPHTTTRIDLTITEWKSAPQRQVASPFQETIQHSGRSCRRLAEWVMKNPFYYDFPRQAVSFALPPGAPAQETSLLLLSSIDPKKSQVFQLGSEGITFFTNLPQLSDLVFALYQIEGILPVTVDTPSLTITPEADGRTAVIETGAASFRVAYGEGNDVIAPLVSVRGRDGIWRGQGRFRLPDTITILSRATQVIESGPLVLSIQINYLLSTGTTYTWILTAHRDEAYLLVREISPEIEGASFEFSLHEFNGGRGYLHWKAEGGDRHWTDLTSENRELARIQESVAWWLPPQGFAYGMTPKELDRHDFIAVFSRRRGEWIDRKFAGLAQGPGENRELDWPFPEMVGSTVSMITAHTDQLGDAYFRFGFFDGERQWGILVSEVEKNDGPFKELSAVQHKNSSPRLQDYKDWNLDEQDSMVRPFVVAHRRDLPELRKKKSSPVFAPFWDRIVNGKAHGGSAAALLFAIDNNPLAAWRKKLELVYAARIRSKMILLGRDFGDCYSPVGARPVAPWAESYDLIAASGCFTPEEERLVRQFLVLMGHMHMEPDLMNWKYNSRNANFEADRTDLVGTIGLCFLGSPDAKKFIDHCISLTEKSLEVYCTPGSGRWYENPACYYLHATRCRINLLFHLYRHGLFDATRIPRLKDLLQWGTLLLTPRCPSSYEEMRDGLSTDKYLETDRVRRIPPIGDHAHIGPWVPDHYAIAAKIYWESDPEFSDLLLAAFHEGGRDGGVYGNEPAIFCTFTENDLRPTQLPTLPSRRLEGFGAIFRGHFGTDREFYLLLKQGPGGYRYHRTEGSIILFAEGRPLIYEGGEAGDTWRHSTLSFYDADMPLAVGHVERFVDLPGLGFVQGVHPVAIKPGDPIYLNDSAHHTLVPVAHARFNEPNPVDLRSLFTVHDEYVIMHDDLRLNPEIPCRWHLQVVSDAHTGKAQEGYVFQGRFGVDLQVLFPGQVFLNEKVEHLPIHDYKAAPKKCTDSRGGYFFQERRSNAVRPPEECFATRHLMVEAESPTHYLALLRPLSGIRKPVEAWALSQNDRTVGVAIWGQDIDDLIFFHREPFVWKSEGIRFEGRYAAVLRRAESVRVILLAGTFLEVDGLRLTSDGPLIEAKIKANHVELTAEGTGRMEISGLVSTAAFELCGSRMTVSLDRR